MPELAQVEKVEVAGMMNRGYRSSNQEKIRKDEEELEKLLKGDTAEEEQAEEPKEATAEKPKEEDEELSGEEKSFKKRYGDLRRHMQQKEKEWEEKFKKLEERSNTDFIPPASGESVQAWMKKYPEIAGIVKSLAQQEADARVASMEGELKNFSAAKEEAARMQAENLIRQAHSDFDELKNSDDFHAWADEQPKWVQDALYENADDPKSVIRVIDLYKVDKGLDKKSRKEKEKEAASAVNAKSRVKVEDNEEAKMWSESKVAALNDRDYEKYEKEILEAMRTGNFIYDKSGAAR
jgi:hypothetical protein